MVNSLFGLFVFLGIPAVEKLALLKFTKAESLEQSSTSVAQSAKDAWVILTVNTFVTWNLMKSLYSVPLAESCYFKWPT